MELRGVLESSDVAEIQAKTDALQEAWTRGRLGDLRAGVGARRRRPATARSALRTTR